MTMFLKALGGVALAVWCVTGAVWAAGGVGLNKTRVIFSNGERAESLAVKNNAAAPWLVQVRVLGEHEQDERSMVVTPPLFRLEANGQNNLRILSVDNGAGFPTDRESLRYVQVTAIPSSSQAKDAVSALAVAVGFRIKLLWRPKALPEPGKKAFQNVKYQRQGTGVQACNGTPYYLSFNRLEMEGKSIDLNRSPSMLPPFGCVQYPNMGAVNRIRWSLINDYGGDSGWFEHAVQ
ncbi:TPA: molecular chaperone [Serratia marcescens]